MDRIVREIYLTVKVRITKGWKPEQLGFDQAVVSKKGIYFIGETEVAKIVQQGTQAGLEPPPVRAATGW